MTPQITIEPAEELGRRAAELIDAGMRDGSVGILGVATGSSPQPIYRQLALRGVTAPETVRLVALDEYIGLAAGHPQNYSSFVKREIADPLGIDASRVHVPDDAQAFEATLLRLGGADLQIVGIGANGHLGFNEPGSSFDSRTRIVELTARTRADNARFFDHDDEVPTHAITQGIATILSARRILLIATGAGKAAAIERALAGPVDESCPASVLQHHPNVTVLLDAAAASRLSEKGVFV